MENITVDIKVGKIIKEFILCTNGSSNIVAQKDDILWCLVKQNLLCAPLVPVFIKDDSEYITITLPTSKSAFTYNINAGRNIQANTLFRNYLDDCGQKKIRMHFEKEYRNVFSVYMRAQIISAPDIMIKDAIDNFCTDYNLTLDYISISALKKYWYRYRLRKNISNICPLIF